MLLEDMSCTLDDGGRVFYGSKRYEVKRYIDSRDLCLTATWVADRPVDLCDLSGNLRGDLGLYYFEVQYNGTKYVSGDV